MVPGLLLSSLIATLAITYCSTISSLTLGHSVRLLYIFVFSSVLGLAASSHRKPWSLKCQWALSVSDTAAVRWGTEAWGWLSFNFWVWSYLCGLTAGDYKVLYGIGTEKKHTDRLLSGHLCLFILGTFSTYSVSHLSHMQYGTDSGYRYIYILPLTAVQSISAARSSVLVARFTRGLARKPMTQKCREVLWNRSGAFWP